MAKCETVEVGQTPTLVWSGSGEVTLQKSGSGTVFIGGSDVDDGDAGLALSAEKTIRVLSDDTIYAYATLPFPGAHTYVKVFSCR